MPVTRNESVLYFILLLVVLIPLFSFGLSNHGLWTADEPRVAEIGREMALSGNWSVPTLDQRTFLEEPPLYYASLAFVFRVFGGASDATARIPSAVFALAGAVALFFLGKLLFGPRTGFMAAFIMATCGEYFRVAHWVIVDSALTCFVILSMTFFVGACISGSRAKKFFFYSLCYVSCTLAFFVKGFIGIVIPGLAALTFLAVSRNLREVLRMHLWLGILIFLAMTMPWFLSLWHHGGSEYLGVFLVHNHLERFAGGSTGHHQPFYYYLLQFPTAFLPWSLLTAPVLYRAFLKQDGRPDGKASGKALMLCWFITGFVFLSLASTKRTLYLMPLFAPISLLTAAYIDAVLAGAARRKWENIFAYIFCLLPLLAGIAAVPCLVVASKKYGFDLPVKELVLTIIFSVAAVALSVAALWRHSNGTAKFWTFSSASILSLLFLGLLAAMPILDNFKSFVPFCKEITARVPLAEALYAWKPDETLRGAVPFYTGRFLKEIDSMPELDDAFRKQKSVFVVIRDKRGKKEKELLSTGEMHVVYRYPAGTDRCLTILRGITGDRTGAGAVPVENAVGETK